MGDAVALEGIDEGLSNRFLSDEFGKLLRTITACENCIVNRGRLLRLLLLGFAILSVRGLIDPQQASARFGEKVSDPAGALFYRVYLSRNLVIVRLGLTHNGGDWDNARDLAPIVQAFSAH